jgi:hypothetical protein
MVSVAQRWFGGFMGTVKTHEASTAFREAAEGTSKKVPGSGGEVDPSEGETRIERERAPVTLQRLTQVTKAFVGPAQIVVRHRASIIEGNAGRYWV